MPISQTGRSKGSSPEGFSLFELLLVLVILVVFSTLLSMRLGGGLGGGDLKLASRIVTAEIRHARGKAAHSHTTHILVFDFDRNEIHTRPEADRSKGNRGLSTEEDSFSSEAKWTSLPPGVVLEDVVVAGRGKLIDGQAGIRFSPNGSAEQSLIHLKDQNGESVTLEIKPLTVQVRVHAGYLDQET